MNCTWLMGCKRIRSESSPGLERWPGTAACGNWRPPFTATCRPVWTRNAPASPLLRFSQVHALALATVACPSDSSSARSTRHPRAEYARIGQLEASTCQIHSHGSMAWVPPRENHCRCRHQQQAKATHTARVFFKDFRRRANLFQQPDALGKQPTPSCCCIANCKEIRDAGAGRLQRRASCRRLSRVP